MRGQRDDAALCHFVLGWLFAGLPLGTCDVAGLITIFGVPGSFLMVGMTTSC